MTYCLKKRPVINGHGFMYVVEDEKGSQWHPSTVLLLSNYWVVYDTCDSLTCIFDKEDIKKADRMSRKYGEEELQRARRNGISYRTGGYY